MDWTDGHSWGEARWNHVQETEDLGVKNEKFQPQVESKTTQLITYREIPRDSVSESFVRASKLGECSGGSLRMYEGRFTYVRQRVRREEIDARDLGQGRKEKFSPEEVEEMLSRPMVELQRLTTERSTKASQPSVVDN